MGKNTSISLGNHLENFVKTILSNSEKSEFKTCSKYQELEFLNKLVCHGKEHINFIGRSF